MSPLPAANRVYSVSLEMTYDFGRLKKYFTTVVAAPDPDAALAKAKGRCHIYGEITGHRIVQQPGARW